MKLNETVEAMRSEDYKEEFRAEYYQLAMRLNSLKTMLEQWDKSELEFKPVCPRSIYDMQVLIMKDYLSVLETRAAMESIELEFTCCD